MTPDVFAAFFIGCAVGSLNVMAIIAWAWSSFDPETGSKKS